MQLRRIIFYYGLTEVDLIMMGFMVPHHTTSKTSKTLLWMIIEICYLILLCKVSSVCITKKVVTLRLKGLFFGYGILSVGK